MNVLLAVVSVVGGLALPTIAITLWSDARNQRRARADAIAERQRQLINRVLDAVAHTMRQQASLAWYVGAPTPVDFAALYPRVLLDVGKGNEDIASWVWRQVQHMLASPSPNDPIRLGGVIAGQLMAWQRGDIGLDWFSTELTRDPVATAFRVPARTQLAHLRRRFGVGALLSMLLTAAAFTVQSVWRGTEASSADAAHRRRRVG